jgi:hypothetical protein
MTPTYYKTTDELRDMLTILMARSRRRQPVTALVLARLNGVV